MRSLLIRAVLRAIVYTLLVAGGYSVVSHFQPDATVEFVQPEPEPGPSLIEQHDCWTGAAPADMVGEFPGHVVVTKPSGRTVYAGPRMVGRALEQVFEDADHGLIVRGFCR